jgi:hypothetical protein
MEVGGYMLLVRDEMKSWQLPLWASDGDAQDGREDATSDQRIGGLR